MGQAQQTVSLGKFWLAISSVPQFFTCYTIHKAQCCCALQVLGRKELNTNAFQKSEILGRNHTHIHFLENLKQHLLFYTWLADFLPVKMALVDSTVCPWRQKTKLTNACQAGSTNTVICIFSVENRNLLSNLKFLMANFSYAKTVFRQDSPQLAPNKNISFSFFLSHPLSL